MATVDECSRAWSKYAGKGPTPLVERMSHKIDKPTHYLQRILTARSGLSHGVGTLSNGFPLVRFSDLCAGVKRMPHHSSSPRRLFAKIGNWQSHDNIWSYTLVISTDFSENPFEENMHSLVEAFVFTRCNLPAAYSTSVYATVHLSLEQPAKPSSVCMVAIQPQTLSIVWDMHELSETYPVAANTVSASRLLHLLSDLGRISPDYLFLHFDLRGEVNVSDRVDLSGIGLMLQDQQDIVNYIVQIGLLSLRDVKNLAGTCRALRTMLADESSRRLQMAFAPFFPDAVTDFAAALRDHSAIIGGSTMLSIVKPGNWKPSDLDVIVPDRPNNVASFVRFLQRQGYTEDLTWRRPQGQDTTTYPPAQNLGFNALDWFHMDLSYVGRNRRSGEFRYACFKRGLKKIDLCVVSNTPASHILTYHSSAVMNLYDGRAIFCLFPEHTFAGTYLRNKSVTSSPEKLQRALTKLKARGFLELTDTIQDLVGERGTDQYHGLSVRGLRNVWREAVAL